MLGRIVLPCHIESNRIRSVCDILCSLCLDLYYLTLLLLRAVIRANLGFLSNWIFLYVGLVFCPVLYHIFWVYTKGKIADTSAVFEKMCF